MSRSLPPASTTRGQTWCSPPRPGSAHLRARCLGRQRTLGCSAADPNIHEWLLATCASECEGEPRHPGRGFPWDRSPGSVRPTNRYQDNRSVSRLKSQAGTQIWTVPKQRPQDGDHLETTTPTSSLPVPGRRVGGAERAISGGFCLGCGAVLQVTATRAAGRALEPGRGRTLGRSPVGRSCHADDRIVEVSAVLLDTDLTGLNQRGELQSAGRERIAQAACIATAAEESYRQRTCLALRSRTQSFRRDPALGERRRRRRPRAASGVPSAGGG